MVDVSADVSHAVAVDDRPTVQVQAVVVTLLGVFLHHPPPKLCLTDHLPQVFQDELTCAKMYPKIYSTGVWTKKDVIDPSLKNEHVCIFVISCYFMLWFGYTNQWKWIRRSWCRILCPSSQWLPDQTPIHAYGSAGLNTALDMDRNWCHTQCTSFYKTNMSHCNNNFNLNNNLHCIQEHLIITNVKITPPPSNFLAKKSLIKFWIKK